MVLEDDGSETQAPVRMPDDDVENEPVVPVQDDMVLVLSRTWIDDYLEAMDSNAVETDERPADGCAVAGLERRTIRGLTEDRPCVICLECWSDGDRVVGLSCDHSFCEDCIVRWLSTHDSCPECRRRVE